jgi:hypothetical protein
MPRLVSSFSREVDSNIKKLLNDGYSYEKVGQFLMTKYPQRYKSIPSGRIHRCRVELGIAKGTNLPRGASVYASKDDTTLESLIGQTQNLPNSIKDLLKKVSEEMEKFGFSSIKISGDGKVLAEKTSQVECQL